MNNFKNNNELALFKTLDDFIKYAKQQYPIDWEFKNLVHKWNGWDLVCDDMVMQYDITKNKILVFKNLVQIP